MNVVGPIGCGKSTICATFKDNNLNVTVLPELFDGGLLQ